MSHYPEIGCIFFLWKVNNFQSGYFLWVRNPSKIYLTSAEDGYVNVLTAATVFPLKCVGTFLVIPIYGYVFRNMLLDCLVFKCLLFSFLVRVQCVRDIIVGFKSTVVQQPDRIKI